ncbi:Acetolactate synthase, mitochondrial [Linnemannia exigua]|uniref:acetolactate synthase n=1 Tax=Linnemannia exigua TaxID=604196 RepID=A0AAD4D670_9FUNG|nr:Acetolactate synthase, mitochondrial [Linnemannia exigua]
MQAARLARSTYSAVNRQALHRTLSLSSASKIASTQIRFRSSAATAEATSTSSSVADSSATPQLQPLERQQQPTTAKPAHDHSFVGMSGGQIFHEMMLRHNVKHVFGYPGGAILPVFDAIYNSKQFEFILPRAEQGAGHAAEGYARVTGKPGVVLVTSGCPLRRNPHGISRACTKWNVMVKDIADLPRRINEAFEIATSGRPGPVLVDLPKDVTAAILNKAIPAAPSIPARPPTSQATFFTGLAKDASQVTSPQILRAARLINAAKRPIIYAGQGILAHPDGPARLKELSHNGNIPVTTTLQGLGAFDEMDHRSLHMVGMHGSAYANLAMQKADVIIALGARFDDRVTANIARFAPEAKKAALEKRGGIIHFEISPKNINKVVQATEAIEGDVTENLTKLLPLIENSERKEWFTKLGNWKSRFPFYHVQDPKGVAQHQMWAAQYFRWRQPRSLVTSGGLGTMGFGLPAAIGAKVGKPDHIVIDIDGDASFCMTGMELATAAQYNIGVKVLILNNDFQGMVKQWQDLFYEERYSATQMFNPDFVKLAEAMNIKGLRATSMEDLPGAMAEFLAHDGPVVLEAKVCKRQHVYPMAAASNALDEFIVHPDQADQSRD